VPLYLHPFISCSACGCRHWQADRLLLHRLGAVT